MTKTEKADCRKIAEHYGWQVEKDKLIEEMGELKEALEAWREGTISSDVEDHIAEETAEVEICFYHLKYFGREEFKDMVKEYRAQKIARQLKRMEAGK